MLARSFAVAFLGAVALAGGVGNVSHSPVVVHTDLQAAIDAAADGDVLLVHGGTYSGFTIDNRSIAIFGVPGETVDVQGRVDITNVPSSKWVVLSDIDVHETIPTGVHGYRAVGLTNCAGTVWIQGCTLAGSDGKSSGGFGDGGFGGAGLLAQSSTRLVVVGSTLTGGKGGYNGNTSCFPSCTGPGDGGAGILLYTGSRVALYDCDLVGGAGGDGGYQAGRGGDGLFAATNTGPALLANCSSTGGDGGYGIAYKNGDGGHGVRYGGGSGAVYALDTLFVGGQPGQGPAGGGAGGAPILGPVTTLAPSARTFTTQHIARGASSVPATVGGVVGDTFFAAQSGVVGWLLQLGMNGVWTLRYPTTMPKTPLAVLPPSGATTASWNAAPIQSGTQANLRFVQGYALPQAGGAVAASPACTLLLDVGAQPDCDGNGVFDALDVAEGAPDGNLNFVPDACELQPVWYVDDSAPPGGDGSLAWPFQAIQDGVDAVIPGRTVEVLDGVYTGARNRELDFNGKAIVLRSQNGPANCIIDCQSLGRAVHLSSGEALGTRFQGFTIRNGRIAGLGTMRGGGAVLVESGATVELAECVLESNFAEEFGGALAVRASAGPVSVRDCSFTSNATTLNLGNAMGGAIRIERDASILRCTFVANQSYRGGAIHVSGPTELRLSHSSFLGNSGSDSGGAIGVEVLADNQSARLIGSNLLFAGNHSDYRGGALETWAGYQNTSIAVDLQHSTFTANSTHSLASYAGGGGIYVGTGTNVGLRNVLLWSNTTASPGPQMRLESVASLATLDYCDVEGGPAGVYVGPGVLNWGTGNLALDPQFVDADGADNDPATFDDNVYRLKPTSPCLDAGDSIHALADVTDIDGDLDFGEPVPLDLNLKPRFKDLPSVPDTGVGSPPIDLGCFERQN
ncbi:MAG: hypothetical protein IT453_09535 [Planctomycetes bacterium]|nr:hypothetical protein [Planctomycetota bacterium]